MIENISNNLIDTSLQKTETQASQAVSASNLKSAYGINNTNLIDETNISKEAVALYEKEQEINKYKSYLDDISEEEATQQVVDLMDKGIINISDEELAESMFNNLNVLQDLFNE